MVARHRIPAQVKWLLALILALTPILGSSMSAGAQDTGLVDDTTFVSALTDEEVTWTSDWEVNEDALIEDADFESLSLSGDAGLIFVTYAEAGGSNDSYLSGFLTGFSEVLGEIENVEADDTGDTWYSLDMITGDDVDVAMFSVLGESGDYVRIVSVIAAPDVIGDSVDAVKSDLEFDGDDALEEIDSVTDSRVRLASSSSEDDDEEEEGDDEDVTIVVGDDEEDEEEAEATATAVPDDEDEAEDDGEEDEDTSDGGSGQDSPYTFGLNDVVVEWEQPWEFDDSLNIVESNYESVGFFGGTAIQSILYMPTGVDLEEARDSFLEGFASDDVAIEVVDRGAYGNVSYSLDLAEIDDVLFGLFTVYIDDGEYVLSYATLTLADDLGESVDLAKETITIDGEAVYNGVTGGGLQDLLDGSIDSFDPTDTVETDDGDDTESPEADDDDAETPEADDEDVDEDAEEFLQSTRNAYDELDASVERFDELFASGELSDADIEEIVDILELWGAASLNAGGLEAPEGYEDVLTAFQDYTNALTEAGLWFMSGISAEADSAEQEEAFDAYAAARADVDEYGPLVDELLTDAGY